MATMLACPACSRDDAASDSNPDGLNPCVAYRVEVNPDGELTVVLTVDCQTGAGG